MATTIAISGKGGSGKTTLAALMIRAFVERSSGPVLAVDADPNSCLGLTLGVEAAATVAEIREDARRQQPGNAGTDKVRLVEYGLQRAVTEAKGFDLLTMGRPEGPDCYCAVNNLLRKFLDKLGSAYGFVVIDNEAGMEHLSRRTTNDVDLLCIAAEANPLGALTAKRIFELARSLPVSIQTAGVIWNKSDNPLNLEGLETLGFVPYDAALFDASMQGRTIFDVENDSMAFSAVLKILRQKLDLKV